VVLVMFVITVTQTGISYSVGQGPLRKLEPIDLQFALPLLYTARIAVLLLLVLLWLLERKRALFLAIIAVNA
jgi:hypothetical protein